MRTENRPAIMHPRSFARRWMRRVLTLPLMFVVVALVLFDDLFRPWVKSAVARLARLPLWRWIESRTARLSPYAALTLFLIPVAIIEPLKIYALYLMGLGHVIAGVSDACGGENRGRRSRRAPVRGQPRQPFVDSLVRVVLLPRSP